MDIKVNISYPDDMEGLEKKAIEIMSTILVNKLQPKEILELVKVLEDDCNNIFW